MVTKITEYEAGYLIYARRSDSVFRIVSDKKPATYTHCKKIEVGREYDFHFKTMFSGKYSDPSHIDGIGMGKEVIFIDEPGMVRNLYFDTGISNL